MIKVEIPGRDTIEIDCLVLDYNGTIANDGLLIDGVEERLTRLKQQVEIHVLTADTYGTAKEQCDHLGVILDTFPKANAADCKLDIVKGLGKGVMCIGNGYNDIKMFDQAQLSVAVLEEEGMCGKLLAHADVVTRGIPDALDLVLKPNRLKATLRS